jgi:hypothetical protein
LEEIERLSHMLRTGQNPAVAAPAANGNGHNNVEEMEEND